MLCRSSEDQMIWCLMCLQGSVLQQKYAIADKESQFLGGGKDVCCIKKSMTRFVNVDAFQLQKDRSDIKRRME